MKSGTESKPYRTFRQATERALEEILRNSHLEINDIARGAFTQMVAQAIFLLKQLPHGVAMNRSTQAALTKCNADMDAIIAPAADNMAKAWQALKRRAIILSHVGSAEAVGRLTGKEAKFVIAPGEVNENSKTNFEGVPLVNRTTLALSRVKRKILDALEFAIVQELPEDEAIQKIIKALPPERTVKRPKRVIQKLTEAEIPDEVEPFGDLEAVSIGTAAQPVALSSGFVSDEEWDDIVNAYKQAYIPTNRSPSGVISDSTKPDGSDLYEWEVEKETTHEFITDVRNGDIQAANENGITDFIWVAVVDQATDECCLWRDGLLLSEIEKQASSHKDEDEKCGDGIVPPIHFNCRCTLAPAVDDIPEIPDNNLAEFEDWLNV